MSFRKSIRYKLFLILSMVSVLPVLLLFLISIYNNWIFYNQQVSSTGNSEVKRITSEINGDFEALEDVIWSLIESKYENENCFTEIIRNEAAGRTVSSSERLRMIRMFKYISSNLISNANYVEGVYLFCENDTVYSYMRNLSYGLEETYQDAAWYQRLREGEDLQVIDFTTPYGNNLSRKSNPCIVVGRKFKDVSQKSSGVVAIVCSNQMFQDAIDQSAQGRAYFVLNESGNMLYGDESAFQSVNEEQKAQILSASSGIVASGLQETKYIYGTLGYNNWKIVANVSVESYYDSYRRNLTVVCVLIVFIIIFMMIVLFYLDRNFFKPIIYLTYVMDKTEDEFSFDNIYSGREDEIGRLYMYFGRMLERIQNLIREKYESEINILNARLRSLLSQINAHFIFNTLENINCIAAIEGNKRIETMSKALGDMLWYSMDVEGDYTRLEKEFNHISQYLEIQKIRFENRIEVQFDLPDGLRHVKVMKFMLQPIVENAVEHGMPNDESGLSLQINACRSDDGYLNIEISDDGIGMDKEQLEKIRRRMNGTEELLEEKRPHNIGLSNIQQRIKLLYSEQYGLEIESESGIGTIVTIKLPLEDEM